MIETKHSYPSKHMNNVIQPLVSFGRDFYFYCHVNVCVHVWVWIHEELQFGQLQAVQIRCLEGNSGPLQEQYALLHIEPPL